MNKIIVSSLNLITNEDEPKVLKKVEKALNCSLIFVKEDEDFNKSWECFGLGIFFYFSYSHFRLHKEKLFTLSARTDSTIEPIGENTEQVFIDFHFKALLQENGFENVMTNMEYGQYLDSIKS